MYSPVLSFGDFYIRFEVAGARQNARSNQGVESFETHSRLFIAGTIDWRSTGGLSVDKKSTRTRFVFVDWWLRVVLIVWLCFCCGSVVAFVFVVVNYCWKLIDSLMLSPHHKGGNNTDKRDPLKSFSYGKKRKAEEMEAEKPDYGTGGRGQII